MSSQNSTAISFETKDQIEIEKLEYELLKKEIKIKRMELELKATNTAKMTPKSNKKNNSNSQPKPEIVLPESHPVITLEDDEDQVPTNSSSTPQNQAPLNSDSNNNANSGSNINVNQENLENQSEQEVMSQKREQENGRKAEKREQENERKAENGRKTDEILEQIHVKSERYQQLFGGGNERKNAASNDQEPSTSTSFSSSPFPRKAKKEATRELKSGKICEKCNTKMVHAKMMCKSCYNQDYRLKEDKKRKYNKKKRQ